MPDGMMKDVVAIVLAAGEGTRMKSAVPKVLEPLCGRPMLGYTVESIRAAGIKRIFIVVGYSADKVREAVGDKRVEFLFQGRRLGTADAVLKARNKLAAFKGTVLVLYGDTPLIRPETIRRLLDAHRKGASDCTLLTAYLEDPKGYGRVVRNSRGDIERIVEEWDISSRESALAYQRKRGGEEVNAGFYCFRSPGLFSVLRKIRPDNKKKEYYLTEAISLFSGKGGRLGGLSTEDTGEMLGVNSQADLAAAERLMRKRIIGRLLEKGVKVVDPSTTYVDADVEAGSGSIIYPMTVIEGGVRIGRRCRVGPLARLRRGTVLSDGVEVGNFAELVRTKVNKKTKIKHHCYLGDCAVGSNVNIGAGTISANYDGKKKNKTVIGDGAFIGTGTIFIAPCSVGKGATTGAGCVITRGTRIAQGSVAVGIPARVLKKKK